MVSRISLIILTVVFMLKVYKTENEKMKMLTDINMNNHKITDLAEPTNDSDPVTKKYINTLIKHNITKRYVEISLQNHDTFINILTNNDLTFVVIPDLYNVDIDSHNRIGKITDRKNDIFFAQSNDSYKPIFKFDEDYGKYYMSFSGANNISHHEVDISYVVGSSNNTNTTFILVKTNDSKTHPIFDMGSDFRFGITPTSVQFNFHRRYSANNLSIPIGSIQLFTIRIGPQNSTNTLEIFQGVDFIPIISSQNIPIGGHLSLNLDIGATVRHGNFDLYAFMIYNKNLSNDQIKHIHKYFQNTYFNFEP